VSGGNVSGLPHTLEVVAAELLCGAIPCAEKVRFLKTGAEAVAAAVRLARTYTDRDRVLGCGYFGWLDWCSPEAGVPGGTKNDFMSIAFDDVAALERAVSDAGDRLAAVVIEPVIERLPADDWIARARELCDSAGAVLIFDEIKTGFRLAPGGYQQWSGVTPDLATFGKALANGYPLSLVCGRADLMDAAGRTWISSTLAGEAVALAAAVAVLQRHFGEDVCGALHDIGSRMRAVLEAAISEADINGISIAGLDPMWMLHFEDEGVESRFLREAVSHGVLFKRGAYNFPCLAHDDEALAAIEAAARGALAQVGESA
jgi:glutamate-1-semialdehyde 2,1-aminomutase